MKVTLLGGSGFVGSALGRFLRESGEEVVSLSRPRFDLTRPETYRLIPMDTEVLVHAAGHVGETTDEALIWKTNVESTHGLIRHINGFGQLRLVVYLSSGAVYGMTEGELTCDSPLRPEGLYGVSKMLSERMFETLLRARPVILRLFFPFGPGQRPPRFIPRLIQRVARGETIDVNEDGKGPFVNPIYVDDLLKRVRDILAAPDRVFHNLGGNEILSLREIAERIGTSLGRSPRFAIKPNRSRSMVCRLMPSAVGHRPFEAGLTATIQEASYL